MTQEEILNRVKEHYNVAVNLGYEVIGVFLQGSQNYELDYEGSDIDTKAIVLPKFDDFVINKKPISTTYIMPDNSHLDIKDIRVMFETFKKQNINFIEILFTKYKIINPKYEKLFNPIFENRENIAHYNNYAAINCMCGMALEKYKALEHPYPTTVEKIKKYGYDPKQLHHIIRMNEFIGRYINGESYSDCLISKRKDYLIKVKKGLHTLEEARILAKNGCNEMIKIKTEYMAKNPAYILNDVETVMKEVLINIIKYSFTDELLGEVLH